MEGKEEFDFDEENHMKIRKRLKEREKDSEKYLKRRKGKQYQQDIKSG